MSDVFFNLQCERCRHFELPNFCAAFPDGIPEELRIGPTEHTQPYPGDHGIRFEPWIPPPDGEPAPVEDR